MLGKSNKSMAGLMALCLTVAQCLLFYPTAVLSQAQEYDYEPPLIEPEVVEEADADYRQTFIASVVDDVELGYVTLFYRFVGEVAYQRINMVQVSRSSSYIAHIPTDPELGLDVEYYIEASDTSGNRTLHGYAFSPKVRLVIDPENRVTASPVATEAGDDSGGNKTVWYVIGGAVLLGLIAGLAGGSSDGGSDNCVDGTCDITITLDQLSTN
ncbi:MAG: hypothetical protein KTR35_16535 [Gammaproteobacteria bacterium]|nr:hypothetical protein [Gammaproteobacteria bacterium]